MRWTNHAFAVAAAVLLTQMAAAQNPAPSPPAQPAVIVLDPAHGGPDTGARLSDQLSEKDVNLQIATRLRSLLQVRGFDVRLTRDADSSPAPTPQQRAGMANQSRALACVVLHSTASGTGVHIYASALTETSVLDLPPPTSALVHWNKAQQPFVSRSVRLSSQLQEAFTRSHIPVVLGRSWIAPLDHMQCPAVVVEIAPLREGDKLTTQNDQGYQQQIAEAIAGTLLAWRNTIPVVVQ